MADTRLPLLAQQANLTTVLPLFQQAREASQRNQLFPLQMQQQKLATQAQGLDLEKAIDGMFVQSAQRISPMLERGDDVGAERELLLMKEQMLRNNLPTDRIDQTLQAFRDPANRENFKAGVRDIAQRGFSGQTPGTKEFEYIANAGGFTPEQRAEAARIKAGLSPRAVGSSAITIAETGRTPVVAKSEAAISGAKAKGTELAAGAAKVVNKSFADLEKVRTAIVNYDDAIAALDAGAKTGAIASMLPSIRASSIQLDNAKNRLGLDVIGNVTFGALSKGELDLALSTAIPTNLNEPELRAWLVRKKNAQEVLATFIESAAIFLSKPGNTVAGWIEKNKGGSFGRESGAETPKPAPQIDLNQFLR